MSFHLNTSSSVVVCSGNAHPAKIGSTHARIPAGHRRVLRARGLGVVPKRRCAILSSLPLEDGLCPIIQPTKALSAFGLSSVSVPCLSLFCSQSLPVTGPPRSARKARFRLNQQDKQVRMRPRLTLCRQRSTNDLLNSGGCLRAPATLAPCLVLPAPQHCQPARAGDAPC